MRLFRIYATKTIGVGSVKESDDRNESTRFLNRNLVLSAGVTQTPGGF